MSDDDLLPAQVRAFEKYGIEVSDTGLTFTNPHFPLERYLELGDILGLLLHATETVRARYLFLIGDMLNGGTKLYGEEWSQIEVVLSKHKMSHQRQMNVQSICRRVPKGSRRITPNVTFEHHAEVASLKPNDQKRWLKITDEGGISKAELRARVKAEREGHPDVLDPIEPDICPTCHRPM